METISHRELRNQSGRVLHAIAAGESFTITNHGTPVARLVPVDAPVTELRCSRPAVRRGGWQALERYSIDGSIAETLADLRSER